MGIGPQGNAAKIIADFSTLSALQIENSGGLPLFVGQAEPGTGTGSTGWSIKKLSYDANLLTISQTWASGTSNFDKTWTNRATYNYL